MKSKTRLGNVLLAAGALFLAAALLLTGNNLVETYQAGQTSERLAQEVLHRIESQTQGEDPSQGALAGEEEVPEYLRNPEMEMPVVEIEGNGIIGVLEIPALGLSLPVMSEWSYPNLKLAPCRYSGSAYAGNFTIAGHNYSTHFGPIGELNAGDSITFTDMQGNRFAYEVQVVETLEATAVADMVSEEWDLTLFTCDLSGESRITVRCLRV